MKLNTYNPNSANAVSIVKLTSSARFDQLARDAEDAARCAYWSDFGWQAGDARPDAYVKFVDGRLAAARTLREKAEGLRRNGY